jgi:hypothetical protein
LDQFCAIVVERSDLADDERCGSNSTRVLNEEALDRENEKIDREFGGKRASDVVSALRRIHEREICETATMFERARPSER